MVRKPGKVLCCMFLFASLEVDSSQNLTKYSRQKHRDYLIHTQSVNIKQNMCRVQSLPIQTFVYLFAPLMSTGRLLRTNLNRSTRHQVIGPRCLCIYLSIQDTQISFVMCATTRRRDSSLIIHSHISALHLFTILFLQIAQERETQTYQIG